MELMKKAVLAQREAVVKALRARAEVVEKEVQAAGKKEDAAKVAEKAVVGASIAAFTKKPPEFRIGDTVKISVRIVEGEKERLQAFTGVVIARRGSGMSETFTVRRIVNNEGVERVFPVLSPKIAGIEVIRGGQVRRAKLYFLRDRVGKKTRLKDLKVSIPGASEPAATAEQTAPPTAEPAAATTAQK
jgi:large subunit ribosomal protein L19